ncbi:MAG: RecX family transcriptional regulator [Mediterranea sp.]|jgi:regulatory protein|nr:RecX family transcriptional regulator [Mediterranea sp.]
MTEEEAYNRAAAYCAGAERCRAEIAEKARHWDIPPESVARLLARLVAEKYIDEERYSRAYVHDKYRFAKWGKVKIAQGLRQKQIPTDTARHALERIDDEEYIDILSGLLLAKSKSVSARSEYERHQKLIRFAIGRGFELKDIRRCIDVDEEGESAV